MQEIRVYSMGMQKQFCFILVIFLALSFQYTTKHLFSENISCNQCDYNAKTKGTLSKHIKSRHQGVRFPCDQCDFKATQKASLFRHLASIHKGVKYQCDHEATLKGDL